MIKMKSQLFQDFDERSKEVSKYFIFLKNLEQGTIKLCINPSDKKHKIRTLNSELEKTLKASCFLLLYNLVESTIRNAIEAIFDDLNNRSISFNQIKPGIKRIVLENIKELKIDDGIISQITDISLYVISIGFNKEKMFSGNLDSKKIKKISDVYGFSCETDYSKTAHGHDLQTVKNNRNDLAHGVKSFSDIGREKSADELIKIQKRVIKYLRQILINIEEYIECQGYLEEREIKSE